MPADVVQLLAALYDDPERCAELAQLRYVRPDEPGLRRVRRGRGFTYRDAAGRTVAAAAVRERIAALAIPPAWMDVWICDSPDGHLLAVGVDDRGRRQYLYHERWRSLRDQLNFYRLIGFGAALPKIRRDVEIQLRRRTLDADRVLAAMLRIIDLAALRVGNEEYAEENDSYGLSTLTKRHVRVAGGRVDFCFPAKSGRQAQVSVADAGVSRVVGALLAQRGRRVFAVAGSAIGSDEVNARLAALTGEHLTAKDFRTWKGTVTAFSALRARLAAPDREAVALDAIDAAAELLGNTRAVARAHYVHPDLVADYISGALAEFLAGRRASGSSRLATDERLLLTYLRASFAQRAGDLAA